MTKLKSYKTYNYYVAECHTGTVKVCSNDWLVLYGGGTSRHVEILPQLNCILNLSGMSIVPLDNIILNQPAQKIFGAPPKIEIPEVELNWPDMGIPALGKPFWNWFIKKLKDYAEQEKQVHLLVCCVGGHGRTGTALAILASLTGIIPINEDPIEFIRKNYCDQAIETESQATYIEHITGRKVNFINNRKIGFSY